MSAPPTFCTAERTACPNGSAPLLPTIWPRRALSAKLSVFTGCGGCFYTLRCCRDNAFNTLYERLVRSDGLLFVSPHYAPIPARLCMLLEKMEEIAFLHWWKDSGYRAEAWGIPAGIVSHGGGAGWALKSYKAMVNDTIANATIQCRVVPYHSPWDTGLALPVSRVEEGAGIFPIQRYDREGITLLTGYADMLLQAARAGRSK